MTLTLRVPAFDVNVNPELLNLLWPKWVADLASIFTTLEITDSFVKKEVLLHYGGKDIQRIYDKLKEDNDGYIETVTKISLYFEPDKNRTVSIYRFRLLRQNQNETIDQYIVRLCIAAKMCEFRDEDEEVKNQLIASCLSNSVRNLALRDESVTIPDLLKIARENEQIGYNYINGFNENIENEDVDDVIKDEEFIDEEKENKDEDELYNGDDEEHIDQMTKLKSLSNKCPTCGTQYPYTKKIRLYYSSRKISYKRRSNSFRGGNKRKKRYLRKNSNSNSYNDSRDINYTTKPKKSKRNKVLHFEERRIHKRTKETLSGNRKELSTLVQKKCKQDLNEHYSIPESTDTKSIVIHPESEAVSQSKSPYTSVWENLLIHIEGPVSSGEYFLVLLDEYSRYLVVEIMEALDIKKVILSLDKIFSEFGIPLTVKSIKDGPFETNEYEKYARFMGFELQLLKEQDPDILNLDDDIILLLRELIELGNSGKNNWKREVYVLLRNYRTTPHWGTGIAPVELMFEKRAFRTRSRKFQHMTNNEIVLLEEKKREEFLDESEMENKQYPSIDVGDVVLLKFKLKRSFSPVYMPVPFSVVYKWGNMITARCQNHFVTKHVNFFKKISANQIQSQFSSSDIESSDDSTLKNAVQNTPHLRTKEIIANLETKCYSSNSDESDDILTSMNILKNLVKNV